MTLVPARLGLGLAAVGRPAYITTGRDADLGAPADRSIEAMQARAHVLLDEAWALGIRYVDAARSYGFAERFLGAWLARHPERRTELTIGSKWGYAYVGEWRMDAAEHERKEHSLAMFDRQWPETLAALGTAPDLYLIHSVTPESPALRDTLLLARLRGLAGSGVRVGLSTSGPGQGAVVDEALALADSPFTAVQATWNLRERSAAPALARAHEAGWTVVVKEVLANGELAQGGEARGGEARGADARGAEARDAEAQDGEARDVEAQDGEARDAGPAGANGAAPDALAIGAARAQPWADIVLSGATTPAQLRRGVAAAPVPPDEVAFGETPQDPAEYWRRRSERPWR